MQAILDTKRLAADLKILSALAGKKVHGPALGKVRIVAHADGPVTLEATDHGAWLTCWHGASRREAGSCVVPIGPLISALPDPRRCASLWLEVEDGHLIVTADACKVRIPCHVYPDGVDWPEAPAHVETHDAAWPSAKDLDQSLSIVLPHLDPDATRFALGSVYVEWDRAIDGGRLRIVGTNGRTLAETLLPQCVGADGPDVRWLIPGPHAKLLQAIAKRAPKSEPIVQLEPLMVERTPEQTGPMMATHGVYARTDYLTLAILPTEKRFPDYRQVFPAGPAAGAWTIEASTLHAIGKDAYKLSDPADGFGVALTLEGNGLEAKGAKGAYQSSNYATHHGDDPRPLRAYINSRYLRDAFAPFAKLGQRFYFRFHDLTKTGWAQGPVTLEATDDSTRLVLMPITVEDEPEAKQEAPKSEYAREAAARLARYARIDPDADPDALRRMRHATAETRRAELDMARHRRWRRRVRIDARDRRRAESWGVDPADMAEELARRLMMARSVLEQNRQWRTRRARYARLDPSVWTESDPMRLEKIRQDLARGPMRAMLERGRAARAERRERPAPPEVCQEPAPAPAPAPPLYRWRVQYRVTSTDDYQWFDCVAPDAAGAREEARCWTWSKGWRWSGVGIALPADYETVGVQIERGPLGGLSLTFASKPAEQVRERLKAIGYRWSRQTGTWAALGRNYCQYTTLDRTLAILGTEFIRPLPLPTPTPAAPDLCQNPPGRESVEPGPEQAPAPDRCQLAIGVLDLSTLAIDCPPSSVVLETIATSDPACSLLAACYVPTPAALPAPAPRTTYRRLVGPAAELEPTPAPLPDLIAERLAFNPPRPAPAPPARVGFMLEVIGPKGQASHYHCTTLELGRTYRIEKGTDSDYVVSLEPGDDSPRCECPHFRRWADDGASVICKHIRALKSAGLLAEVASTASNGYAPDVANTSQQEQNRNAKPVRSYADPLHARPIRHQGGEDFQNQERPDPGDQTEPTQRGIPSRRDQDGLRGQVKDKGSVRPPADAGGIRRSGPGGPAMPASGRQQG